MEKIGIRLENLRKKKWRGQGPKFGCHMIVVVVVVVVVVVFHAVVQDTYSQSL
jgi:t-SNARE complex subunit (syntaxin)